MIQLNINAEERQILLEVLSADISDLRMEISGTDALDYREALKKRKAALKKVVSALQ
ncbi:hypothetical protein DESUT3_38400 [Desulfuromonas versatilis]|uniref:Uncharacterized protein n=1 Tax=Desulfuromonas versatilis TaxID=2802975 RepID=A0ABN6E325_9BACT|nr:hypothetical protein [Desulfuromonas versatilis]BCR06771.1 hypothetical protein DESUT3_38400 [Desulfuromonas versatilis]